MEQFADVATWVQGNMEATMFYVLALLAIPLAYGVILDRVIIRSGFLLIGVFSIISGLFLLLQAQFIAMAQIMIYAVGITLVVVIALMLTNPRMEVEATTSSSKGRLPGIMISLFVFLTLYLAIRSEAWPVAATDVSPDVLKVLGYQLMTQYSLPFEFASMLLLAALVGSVMLAKADSGANGSGKALPAAATKEGANENVVKV